MGEYARNAMRAPTSTCSLINASSMIPFASPQELTAFVETATKDTSSSITNALSSRRGQIKGIADNGMGVSAGRAPKDFGLSMEHAES